MQLSMNHLQSQDYDLSGFRQMNMVPIAQQILSHNVLSLQTAANMDTAAGCSSVTNFDAFNAHDIVTATARSPMNQVEVPVAATTVKKAGKRKQNGVNVPKRAKANQGPFACGFCGDEKGKFAVVPCSRFVDCHGSGYICAECCVAKKGQSWLDERKLSRKRDYMDELSPHFLICGAGHNETA